MACTSPEVPLGILWKAPRRLDGWLASWLQGELSQKDTYQKNASDSCSVFKVLTARSNSSAGLWAIIVLMYRGLCRGRGEPATQPFQLNNHRSLKECFLLNGLGVNSPTQGPFLLRLPKERKKVCFCLGLIEMMVSIYL